jgi:hypothetical protein
MLKEEKIFKRTEGKRLLKKQIEDVLKKDKVI